MEGPPNFYTGSLNPRPLRPSIFQHSDPQNVATGSNHKKSHRHRHRHRDHHHEHSSSHSHSHRHSSRQHAKEVVQSTLQLQPPTSFGDLLKQAKGSKDTTPQHSRRQSIAKVDEETTAIGLEIPPPKPIGPDDVAREQRRVKLREEELRASLQSLSDQSLKTSRRLDDSHYTILEKVYQLQRTIDSLQELSDMTEELYENFKTDTKEMSEDVKGQVEGFNNFDVRQEQVTGLEERIKLGKEKADALTARLGEAKERVEARAKVEAEWEARTSRRLRVFWGILASIVGVVVISILVQQFRPIHVAKDHKANLDFAHRDKILDAPIPDEAKEAIIGPTLSSTTQSTKEESVSVHSVVELADDERLRIFDEL